MFNCLGEACCVAFADFSGVNTKRWCCESAALNMPANLENSAVASGLEKISFHSNLKERHAKECANYHTIALISHASKVILKILQARLQQYVNSELPDVQPAFRKGRGTRDQIANIRWIIKISRESISALLTIPKPLTVWITTNYGKFFKRWKHKTILPASWETCMQVRKQQNWTWNNRLFPNQERSMSRLYIVTLLIELICRVHHVKCQAGWSTSWTQDCRKKYQ